MKVAKCGLAYEATGSEKNDFGLVLIHGWGCRHSDYDLVLQQLQPEKDVDYRIVAMDLPGHGETPSQVLPQPSMTGFAEVVLQLCQGLGLKKVVLAGHSMGVRISLEAFRLSLDNTPSTPSIQGIILIDGSNYTLRPSLFAFDKGDARSTALTEPQKAAMRTAAFNDMFSPLTPQSFRDSTLAHIADMDKDHSQAVRAAMISYDRERMTETVELLGKEGEPPVLNIQSSDIGAENQRIPMREGQVSRWMAFLGERVPRARQVVVEGSGHFPHVDRPEVIARLVTEFMREVR
ncbi:hypothetical protein M409DRAFT_17091 [Zasmidium cellare ATCC 36951]|uniref:AB hydrolase-1 domain-containing protein n=1 Tax=Zasmidium cellare ATCC 36951 TaxID=1080233 RepID=A0A6A6D1V2_ZASCE|nr:uncharacterized protein M409DRAFT_17091 [Zasmidium cellare ATCC 36951]KAF2173145.1 hypothetical protein M409DRAFT_17091 [Zasmidium cellare ATCC 36951]